MLRRAVLCVAAGLFVFAGEALSDVKMIRRADGRAVIFNSIGSGWRIGGRAPSDAYLLARRDA
ncbi:MAG TPA: hypothetical protein PKA62_19605, partial [Thermoanaerobaculia bacterium]|nr:hypothetical protein [Thermoanaerobaculia bacterium]